MPSKKVAKNAKLCGFLRPIPRGPISGALELVTTLPEAVAIVQAAVIARYKITLLSHIFVILRLKVVA